MSSAHVEAIEALGELRSSLLRFKNQVQSALNAAEQEARHTLTWLREREYYWKRELERRLQALQEAESALRACQSQVYHDPQTGRTSYPDCSRQQAFVMQARQQVDEARRELQTVHIHLRRVEEAVDRFRRQAAQQNHLLDVDLLKATALLDHSVTILMSYASGGSG